MASCCSGGARLWRKRCLPPAKHPQGQQLFPPRRDREDGRPQPGLRSGSAGGGAFMSILSSMQPIDLLQVRLSMVEEKTSGHLGGGN